MLIDTPQALVPLSAAAPLRLRAARGTRLRSVAGTLWVTVDGDPTDRVLLAGQQWAVDSAGPLLVSALDGPATVGLCGPRRPAPRWRRWLAALAASGTPAAGVASAAA